MIVHINLLNKPGLREIVEFIKHTYHVYLLLYTRNMRTYITCPTRSIAQPRYDVPSMIRCEITLNYKRNLFCMYELSGMGHFVSKLE